MPNKAKIELAFGERIVKLDFEGLNVERQRNLLETVFNSFIADIDEEIGTEATQEAEGIAEDPAAEKAGRKYEKAANALGIEPDKLQAMGKAFATADERIEQGKTLLEEKREVKTLLKDVDSRTYRVLPTGDIVFQAYYICPECKNKGMHYIKRGTPFVNCHKCGKRQTVRPAETGPFPHVDDFGNFYIAGKFKRTNELDDFYKTFAEREQEQDEQERETGSAPGAENTAEKDAVSFAH